jgi:hypothetical protein
MRRFQLLDEAAFFQLGKRLQSKNFFRLEFSRRAQSRAAMMSIVAFAAAMSATGFNPIDAAGESCRSLRAPRRRSGRKKSLR